MSMYQTRLIRLSALSGIRTAHDCNARSTHKTSFPFISLLSVIQRLDGTESGGVTNIWSGVMVASITDVATEAGMHDKQDAGDEEA